MNNRKGFTMVELLASVAILGILSAIAIVSVGVILSNVDKKHYETQRKNMIIAAQSYSQENRNILPKDVGDTRIITLNELQRRKYIGDVVDRGKKECNNAESVVVIFKYSKSDYSYRSYLKCGDKTYGDNPEDLTGPNVNLEINGEYKNASFKYSVEALEGEDSGKIISYGYQVYNYGTLVYDSGNIVASKADKIDEKEVSLKDYVPGEITVTFKASDHYGGITTVTKKKKIIEENGLVCVDVAPNINDWAPNRNEVTLSVTCADTKGSGCAREVFTETFTGDNKTNFITITNNSGSRKRCEVGVYIDNTPPTTPVIKNLYENIWVNRSYTLEVKSSDVTSGIEYFQYRYPNSSISSEREWRNYEESKRTGSSLTAGDYTYTTPAISGGRNEYIEVRACDQAGNCSDAAKSMIKIDLDVPSAPVLTNPYLNVWPQKTDVDNNKYVITVNSTDPDSGIAKYQYRYPNSSSTWNDYASSSGNTFVTPPIKTGKKEDLEIRACDTVGNCSLGTKTLIMIDTSAPSCSISKTGTGSGSSYTSVVTLSLTKGDGTGSGVAAYGLVAGNSTANYNSVSSGTQGQTNGITWYGFAKDAVGNVGSCNSGNFKVSLRTIPEFTYSGSYQIVDDNDNVISNVDSYTGNWKIRFLSSGTLTFTNLHSASKGIDVFLVGGGGNGGRSYGGFQAGRWGYASGGGGGGGGYRTTKRGVSVTTTSYSISVGGARTKSTAFGYTANPGANGSGGFANLADCEGGPAGGSGGAAGGRGGVNICSPYNGASGGCEFDDCNFSSNRYGGGGGGGHGHNGEVSYTSGSKDPGIGTPGNGGAGGGGTGNNQYRNANTHNGQANTGGGGGGASFVYDRYTAGSNCWSSNGCFDVSRTTEYAAGTGGSGIVIIRNKR